MSSLRLALKQSLQDAGGSEAAADNNDAASHASSEENEASLQDLDDNSSGGTADDEEEERGGTSTGGGGGDVTKEHKAAHKIQKHFRKNHASAAPAVRTKKKKAKPPPAARSDHSDNDSDGTSYTVPPPDTAIRDYMKGLSLDTLRSNVTPGLRVKVQFDRANWYGGLVKKVSKDGSKIRIKYDDGTTEVTSFTDDIVVDDAENGEHASVAADAVRVFVPSSSTSSGPTTQPPPPLPKSKPPAADTDSEEEGEVAEEVVSKPAQQGAAPTRVPSVVVAPAPKLAAPLVQTAENGRKTLHAEPPSPMTEALPVGGDETIKVKRKRGRPRKHPLVPVPEGTADPQSLNAATTAAVPAPKEASAHHENKHVMEEKKPPNTAIAAPEQAEPPVVAAAAVVDPAPKAFPQLKIRMPKQTADGGVGGRTSKSPRTPRANIAGSTGTCPQAAAAGSTSNISNVGSPTSSNPSAKRPLEAVSGGGDEPKQPAPRKLSIRIPVHKVKQTLQQEAQIVQDAAAAAQHAEMKALSTGGSGDGGTGVMQPDTTSTGTTDNKKTERQPVVDHDGSISKPAAVPKAVAAAVAEKNAAVTGKEKMTTPLTEGKPFATAAADAPTAPVQNVPAKDPEEQGPAETTTDSGLKGQVAVPVAGADLGEVATPAANADKPPVVKDVAAPVANAERPAVGEAPAKLPSPKSPKQLKKLKKKKLLAAAAAAATSEEGTADINKQQRVSSTTEYSLPKDSSGEAVAPKVRVRTPVPGTDLASSAQEQGTEKHSGVSAKESAASDEMLPSAVPATAVASAAPPAVPEPSRRASGFGDEGYPLDGPMRMERRAAQQANERIVSKQEVVQQDPAAKKEKKRKRRKEVDGVLGEKSGEENDDSQWVQCDKCAKWRIIPSIVVESLPNQWFCSDNVHDPKRASCDAPEQTQKQVAKEKKKLKKRQRMMKAAAAAAAADADGTQGSQGTGQPQQKVKGLDRVRSPRPPREAREDSDKPSKPRRSSPVDEVAVPDGPKERTKKEKKSGLGKRGRSTENMEILAQEQAPEVVKRGRGRPRRRNVNNKEPGCAPQPTGGEADNLEWVQCEKCEKWRKLPPHISADELPDVWTCSLNDWNPLSASCDAAEDKADGLQDVPQSYAGKLTYRNLIFGSTGRKTNRPISERARAAESIFSTQFEEDEVPSKVLYSDSSAFVLRGRPTISADENEGISVLELMSHSHLWQELRGASLDLTTQRSSSDEVKNLACYTFDTLPHGMQQPVKDLLLQVLDAGTFSGDDIVLRAQSTNVESVPEVLRKAHPFCTKNVVITTLCQLVKEGKVDCVQKVGAVWSMKDWNPHYRRASLRPPPPKESPSSKRLGSHRESRCMKISKPWKRASM